jgi:SAM-dependent methyltransferase
VSDDREGHYRVHFELSPARLGARANARWDADPRGLGIVLSRYKFVGKMLAGKSRVLEVGCGDAWASRVVQQEIRPGVLFGTELLPDWVENARQGMEEKWKFDVQQHDMLAGPVSGRFDAAFALDVLEHIPPADEDLFIRNIVASLDAPGVLIFGLPSLESQPHASPLSKEGHVNCKSGPELKALLLRYFHDVFMFSMNDEVVHTGFYAMAHYLFALCVGKRR